MALNVVISGWWKSDRNDHNVTYQLQYHFNLHDYSVLYILSSHFLKINTGVDMSTDMTIPVIRVKIWYVQKRMESRLYKFVLFNPVIKTVCFWVCRAADTPFNDNSRMWIIFENILKVWFNDIYCRNLDVCWIFTSY